MRFHKSARIFPVLLLTMIACTPPGSEPETGGDGTPGGDVNLPPVGAPITQENLAAFSEQLNTAILAAVMQTLEQAPPPAARVLAGGDKTRVDTIENLVIAGHSGAVRVSGVRSSYPLPAKYELSFSLEDYAADDGLLLNGTVEYNFVVDTSSSPPVLHGLYRAALTLGGNFSGEVEVRASVLDGAVRALALTSGGNEMLLNERKPEGFLTYVSTIAGTGKEGFQDGPAAQATFNEPTGIAVNTDGRIYVADQGNGRHPRDRSGRHRQHRHRETPGTLRYRFRQLRAAGGQRPDPRRSRA